MSNDEVFASTKLDFNIISLKSFEKLNLEVDNFNSKLQRLECRINNERNLKETEKRYHELYLGIDQIKCLIEHLRDDIFRLEDVNPISKNRLNREIKRIDSTYSVLASRLFRVGTFIENKLMSEEVAIGISTSQTEIEKLVKRKEDSVYLDTEVDFDKLNVRKLMQMNVVYSILVGLVFYWLCTHFFNLDKIQNVLIAFAFGLVQQQYQMNRQEVMLDKLGQQKG